ncbi:MAG TPA: hypothetical protein VM659_13755 [Dongiaceae bacterium]|nr:hypothetical protein [Dongiaceae bacterium]
MYNEILRQFVEAQQAAHAAYAAAAAFERETLASVLGHQTAIGIRSEYGTDTELRNFCSHLADNIIARARREFAPAGARLDIDDQQVKQEAGIDRYEMRHGKLPDMDALWRSLTDRFGGDNGKALAYKQAAKRIIDGFGLARNREIRRTAAAIVLRTPAMSESRFQTSQRKLSYYSAQRVKETLDGFSLFAATTGHHELAAQIRSINTWELHFDMGSKQAFTGADIVFRKEAWEFKLSHRVGNELAIFVAEHGQDFLKTAQH